MCQENSTLRLKKFTWTPYKQVKTAWRIFSSSRRYSRKNVYPSSQRQRRHSLLRRYRVLVAKDFADKVCVDFK